MAVVTTTTMKQNPAIAMRFLTKRRIARRHNGLGFDESTESSSSTGPLAIKITSGDAITPTEPVG
jgi:hypothetical protein